MIDVTILAEKIKQTEIVTLAGGRGEYIYEPLPDITVYELALIMPMFFMKRLTAIYLEALPQEARRHFRLDIIDDT